MTAGERMSRALVAAEPGTTVREAAERMCDRRVGAILVMDGERLLGILTERDVLAVVARGSVDAAVDEVMTPAPETIEAHEPLEQARVLMLHGGFRHLPVVEGERVVGVLSMRDLLGDALDTAPRGV